MQREMLRASDIAPQLGVTTGRVYQLIAAGVIPAVRIGGAIRIPRAAWERWVDDHTHDAMVGAGANDQRGDGPDCASVQGDFR
jgi:excisionase family DNA binding protein